MGRLTSMLIRSRAALVAVVALLAAILGASAVGTVLVGQRAETTAVQQAAPLDRLCRTVPGAAAQAGADCAQAAQITRDGALTVAAAGEDGADGAPGRGVLGTSVRDGRLIVAYSDGQTEDVGQVVGDDGVGIAASGVEDGRLIVSYSDGRRADLGPVVGPAGVGIADVDGTTGRLLVTLTNGEVIDAGPLPPGQDGIDGESAPPVSSVTRTYADGTVEQCTRDGGPDTDPVFACERERVDPDEQTGDPPP